MVGLANNRSTYSPDVAKRVNDAPDKSLNLPLATGSLGVCREVFKSSTWPHLAFFGEHCFYGGPVRYGGPDVAREVKFVAADATDEAMGLHLSFGRLVLD